MPGVAKAVVALTAAKTASRDGAPQPRPAPAAHSHAGHSHGAPQGKGAIPQKAGIPGIGAIIAVASGKGGVGKSTTAVNLALALKANGLKVGVLDADIYGPSMPRLLGIKGKPQQTADKRMMPMDGYGMPVMSIGFLVEEETPMIWRGPMVMSALTQMMREVEWGSLDVLGCRYAAWHGRRAAHHGATGAAGGRGDRIHAAGSGADRRAQGPQHVPAGGGAGPGHRREHELFHRARHRQALRHFRPWRERKRKQRVLVFRSSAKCRSTWPSARPLTPGFRSLFRSRAVPMRKPTGK